MHTTARLAAAVWVAVVVVVIATGLGVAADAPSQPAPLKDPIPAKISKGEVTVVVRDFVRLPKTTDSGKPPSTTDAYARIQYLLPARDGSGRLFVNDTRGVLYVTDATG